MEILRNGWGTESTSLICSNFRKDTSLPAMQHKLKYYRDLNWMLHSGPMLERHPRLFTPVELRHFYEEEASWLEMVKADPDELNEFMKPAESEILGRIYERLFLFWLSKSPNFRLIANNVQIHISGKTATEVDFIAEHIPTSTIYHFEVSCKYYLGYQNSSLHEHWVGPNGSDNLRSRMKRMDQQLAVFDSAPGKALLRELGIPEIKSRGWLKGYLFFPYNELSRCRLPANASGQVPGGWYMRASDTEALYSETGQWLSLPKSDWISPIEEPPALITPMNGRQLIQYVQNHFSLSDKALLLIQVNDQGMEMTRGFIVANGWPEKGK